MNTNTKGYDFEKIEAELKAVTGALLQSDNPDTLLALRDKKHWLESKLKSRDLLAKAVKAQKKEGNK